MTSIDKARAATNDPALSQIKVVVGDRTFTVVDLPYDEHVKFLAFLTPLLESVAGRMVGVASDSGFSAAGLIRYCMADLPEMACIVCRQTDPDITPDDIKKLARSPLALASVVVAQINHNQTIEDIVSFFQQMLPLLKIAKTASK